MSTPPAIGLSEKEQAACDNTVALIMELIGRYLTPGSTDDVRILVRGNVEHLAVKIKRYARQSAH